MNFDWEKIKFMYIIHVWMDNPKKKVSLQTYKK
jgi:hypothetical protein